jgi:hypothetical protein
MTEEAVREAEALIGARENAELVAKGEDLEQDVSPRAQGGSMHRNRPRRVPHWRQNGWQAAPASTIFCLDAIMASDNERKTDRRASRLHRPWRPC